ncbi:hypothetical protein KR032_000383, partial [Drosophila birchii]
VNSFSRCILIFSSLNVILEADAKGKEGQKVADDPHCDYNEIVRNMIRSWEAPVAYLRGRGFLPKDYQDTSKIKPSLDAMMQRLEKDKREAKNQFDEAIGTQMIKGSSKEKKLSGWVQLQALSSKLTGNRSKQDERGGKLLAMKRRLDELESSAKYSPHLPEIQMNAKVAPVFKPNEPVFKPKEPVLKSNEPPQQKDDDILQRIIEKSSPHSGRQQLSFRLQSPKAPASTDDNPVTSAPISLSTYRPLSFLPDSIDNIEINMPKSSPPEAQKGNGNEAASSLKTGMGLPTFLSWDIKTGRLDHYSHKEKEAYLNKLLNAYQPKLDAKEAQGSSENPMGG